MKRKLMLSLVTVLAILLVGELVCRGVWSAGDLQLSPESAHLRDHPTRLWVQAPNLDMQLPEHGRLQTNALGFRDGPRRSRQIRTHGGRARRELKGF